MKTPESNWKNQLSDSWEKLVSFGCKTPFLLKPCAGGFGDGIAKFDTKKDIEAYFSDLDTQKLGNDGVALLQEFLEPKYGIVHRVWFLNGKVQCAVKSTRLGNSINTFTGGCAAGACSLKDRVKLEAWEVDDELQQTIEKIVATCKANCGSIEFLYHNSSPEPFFFDLNMVSTFPEACKIPGSDKVWGKDYNPYK